MSELYQIHSKWREKSSDLFQQFDSAKPFRHIVMDQFFEPEFCNQLETDFPPFDESKAMNENGEIGMKCVHEQLGKLSKPYQQLDELIQSQPFLDWLGAVVGMDELIYDPHYFGGGTHENRHGQDLDPHVDFNKHPITGLHRRLNLIVYLNREWRNEWGGAIEFHKDPRLPLGQNKIEFVQPMFNRAVLFETTFWSWHGFERINLPQGDADTRSRKSVALYFYTRTRPENEQTKPHSTIYVDRPLPDSVQPNQVLSDQDYQATKILVTRRDHHIQRLYRNISDQSVQIEDLIQQRDQAMKLVEELDADATEGISGSSNFVSRLRRWLARTIHP